MRVSVCLEELNGLVVREAEAASKLGHELKQRRLRMALFVEQSASNVRRRRVKEGERVREGEKREDSERWTEE